MRRIIIIGSLLFFSVLSSQAAAEKEAYVNDVQVLKSTTDYTGSVYVLKPCVIEYLSPDLHYIRVKGKTCKEAREKLMEILNEY